MDKLELCGSGEVGGIFWSRQVDIKVKLAKETFGLQDNQILPIANYVGETKQQLPKDILALQAMDNILEEALAYIKNNLQLC